MEKTTKNPIDLTNNPTPNPQNNDKKLNINSFLSIYKQPTKCHQ